MIIECINCNKKFNVDQSLIPENGRQIQCGSCNHSWYFKVELIIPETSVFIEKKIQFFILLLVRSLINLPFHSLLLLHKLI